MAWCVLDCGMLWDAVVLRIHQCTSSAYKVNCWAVKYGTRREKLIWWAAQRFALAFLQLLLERVLSHSTIRVCASAISACHEERLDPNILPWNFSNKMWGGNVRWCALLLLDWNSMWIWQRPIQRRCSGPMGRSLSSSCQLRWQCCLLYPLSNKCFYAFLVHMSCILIRKDLTHDRNFTSNKFQLCPTGKRGKRKSILCFQCFDMLLWNLWLK